MNGMFGLTISQCLPLSLSLCRGHVLVGIFEAIQQEYCKEADWDDKTAKRECVLKFLRKAVLGQRNA